MDPIVRIPITNYFVGGDYTGVLQIGATKKPLNLLLDTGSSALALDGHRYKPSVAGGDKVTKLAQTDSYGDGSSWTGAVVNTSVVAGSGSDAVTLTGANVAIAYNESRNMFRGCDGILGLAYAPLDDAYTMPAATWPKKYTSSQVQQGQHGEIAPYMTQLAGAGVAYERMAFVTRRSFTRVGHGGADDAMNQGTMVIGGGDEATDLYDGAFESVKVLADAWYNTNLVSITVGAGAPLAVSARGPKGMPSNSIVDSGTNSLNLGPQLLAALMQKFSPDQQQLLSAAILHNRVIAAEDLDLTTWPTIVFELQASDDNAGGGATVKLNVAPTDYWQVDAYKAGAALCAITQGSDGLSILGLPLMNGYFTYFDGVADNHRGVIRFAKTKPLA